MPSTIQFANQEQMVLFLQFYQQFYAAASQGVLPQEIAVGLQFVETGGKIVAGQISNAQIQSLIKTGTVTLDTTAAQAFQQYLAAGGTTSNSLAATGTVANEVVANGAVATTSTGAKVVGLLSMNLPTAAAAIAPIAGVALGAGLYSANPELWEKISRALLPFCYDDTELLPVAVDENGNTYYPNEAIDAVKQVVAEIPKYDESADTPIESIKPIPFQFVIADSLIFEDTVFVNPREIYYTVTDIPVSMCYGSSYQNNQRNNINYVVLASLSPFKYVIFNYGTVGSTPPTPYQNSVKAISQNGVEYYYAGIFTSARYKCQTEIPVVTVVSDMAQDKKVAEAMLFGNTTTYPEGITSWKGAQYPSNAEAIDVVTEIDGDSVSTTPYYPIATPIGEPGVSLSPEQAPNLTENQDKPAAVDPWITNAPGITTYPQGVRPSVSAPLENPVPELDPKLDPNEDPSKTPPKGPSTTTTSTSPPVNGGTSPNPQIPIIPVLPSAATGLLHVYNPTQSQIDAFGVWLWTTFSGDLIDTLSKLFNNPMDAVIGLHELYSTPAVSGSATIRAGYLDSNVPSNLVGDRYTTINCGSIVVEEFYQNYLDYSPYTKCYIYLPFVGIVPVLADDIIGNAVNVTYHIDSYTGCCIAVVTVAREGYSSAVYQFEGNCGVEIPITSGYQSTLMSALIGIGATALTGNPHAGIAAANMGRASLGKNDVSHSGSFGSSYGAMGAKTPYIIVKRPTQKSVVNYNQEYGFPAHKRVTIGACNGYLRAREVHVISPTATDEEKARIEELLKSGVFVQ